MKAIDIQTQEVKEFSNDECNFGYRDSIFKNKVKGKFIIISVTFRLTKKDHKIKTNYGTIQQALEVMGIKTVTINDVSNAVIKIRKEKLPDPAELGNSGSFFKNPVITADHLKELQKKYPDIPFYDAGTNEFKIPAGWLVEYSGLKGYREGDAGVHKNQALVLVNYGTATGQEILNLAKKVQVEVYNKFRIALQAEVNIF